MTYPQIHYAESDLSSITEYAPQQFHGGICIAVVEGRATLDIEGITYQLLPQMELSFISGFSGKCINRSPDFKVRLFTYTHALLVRATLKIDHAYFDYLERHPTRTLTCDKRSRDTWLGLMTWMDLAQMLFGCNDSTHKFRATHEENFLQSFYMWLCTTIQEHIDTTDSFAGTQLIAHKFMHMVKAQASTHHRADYYAHSLNISQRYLNRIVCRHMHGNTPKQLIDAQLIAEIKAQLMNPTLTVTQIAERLNFPDQSYLSRFFRRHTGLTPAQYRSPR